MPRKALFLLQDVNLPTFLNFPVSEQVEALGALLSPCLAAAPLRNGGEHTKIPVFQIFKAPRFSQPQQQGHGLSQVSRKKKILPRDGAGIGK